jgi:hypothetical protein
MKLLSATAKSEGVGGLEPNGSTARDHVDLRQDAAATTLLRFGAFGHQGLGLLRPISCDAAML